MVARHFASGSSVGSLQVFAVLQRTLLAATRSPSESGPREGQFEGALSIASRRDVLSSMLTCYPWACLYCSRVAAELDHPHHHRLDPVPPGAAFKILCMSCPPKSPVRNTAICNASASPCWCSQKNKPTAPKQGWLGSHNHIVLACPNLVPPKKSPVKSALRTSSVFEQAVDLRRQAPVHVRIPTSSCVAPRVQLQRFSQQFATVVFVAPSRRQMSCPHSGSSGRRVFF